ncbi:InlB B-repeat-containing protein [Slackia piriformis]|nr:InlB B-repeat-containing protein [Slackia piriformis]
MGRSNVAKRTPTDAKLAAALLAALISALLAFAVFCPAIADAADEGSGGPSANKTVNYDVSKAGKYTNYRITESGDYHLSGQSNSVSIHVEPQKNAVINIYLEGNLKIDPDWYGRRGMLNAAPAISVGEAEGATVYIITKAGANAYLGGYRGAAGIRKNGTATKLVLKTADSSNPGTLTAVGSSYGSCPGIGVDGDKGTVGGNIVIESGKVIARGHDAPGIGCKDDGRTIANVRIEGGTVTATGSGGNSAGIGSGKGGTARDITITGGTVTATGAGTGAGIGSGGNGTAKNISIEGGTVTATGGTGSRGGAGIGSGANGSVQNIVVLRGTVIATGGPLAAGIGGAYQSSVTYITIGVHGQPLDELTLTAKGGTEGAGIGSGSGETKTSVSSVLVRGGTVTATGSTQGGAGIGSGYQSALCTDLRIGGGNVTAVGGRESSDVGTGPYCSEASYLTIMGGLVKATRGEGEGASYVGSNKISHVRVTDGTVDGTVESDPSTPIVVTGGSVRAFASGCSLVDGKGKTVYRTVATVEGLTKSTHIPDLNIGIGQAGSSERLDYGQADLYTLDDDGAQKLFLYLPESTYTRTAIDANGLHYQGNSYPGNEGVLKLIPNVLLSSGETGYDGSAFAKKGENKIAIKEKPEDELGRAVDYYADSDGRKVANAEGNVDSGTTAYTEGGVWTYSGTDMATLQTVWKAKEFTIVFVGNAPEGASTTISGTMSNQTVLTGTQNTLNKKAFVLPGYEFIGWNTDPDGYGDAYNDVATVNDDLFLEADSDNAVTLYAQWEPQTYEVNFDANGGTGTMESQTFVFDQEAALSRNTFNPPGDGNYTPSFLYWQGSDKNTYLDGEVVTNLCTTDEITGVATGLTLTAQWSASNSVIITITNNGEPVTLSNPGEDIKLYRNGDATNPVTGFTVTAGVDGVYQLSNVDEGNYSVDIDNATGISLPSPKSIEVKNGKNNSFNLNYCTVTVKAGDEHVNAWIGDDPSPAPRTWTVFQGTEITVTAATNPDHPYVFAGYDVEGVVPDSFDSTQPESQAIVVTGKVTLTAHARPIVYNIAFQSNRPTNASTIMSGSMESMTGLSAIEDHTLSACAFALPGYTFTGWNTQSDGGGTPYGDKTTVGNLATNDGETVTLHAQWKPISYTVAFNANGGTGSMSNQEFTFDKAQNLTKNAFERTGYTFAGWSTQMSAADTCTGEESTDESASNTYKDSEEVSNLTEINGAVITLYAQWERDTYKVKFCKNADDAVGAMADEAVPTTDDWTISGCGFTRTGYTFTGWNTQADGSGIAYEAGDVVGALADKGKTVTLYAQWKPISYTIAFEANIPTNASTADDASGTMDPLTCIYDTEATLASNAFFLPGYEFTGWNTQPDGSGVPYTDGKDVKNLATEDGETITLYAQWKPRTYMVTFKDADGATGTMNPQELRFDEPRALSENTFQNNNMTFIGWAIEGETGASRLFADEQTVVNLCNLQDDGSPEGFTLQAIWASGNGAYVTLAKDDTPVTDAVIKLANSNTSEIVGPLNSVATIPGTYSLNEIPAGTYAIEVEGYPSSGTQITVPETQTAHVFLNYSTITVQGSNEHAHAQLAAPLDSTTASTSTVVPTGTEASVSASADTGYVFENWTVEGITPTGLNPDNPASQTITVQGKTTLTANVRPISYAVAFDANGGEGYTDPQVFSYDEAQKLTENAFTRDGYTFTGWNTEPDGSGTSYADGTTVNNLTSVDGETITLYAQWQHPSPTPPTPPVTAHGVTVDVHAHGTASVDPATASAGTIVTVRIDPDEGFLVRDVSAVYGDYRLVEVTAQPDGTYTFVMPDADVAVSVLLGCDGGNRCPSRRFADVDTSQWYHDSLDWAVIHGILEGYGNTGLMKPDSPITRAEMAQVLWNLEGRPAAHGNALTFDDVAEGDWFARAVAWASSVGIFQGYGDTGLFGPDDVLTREQSAAVMMRWERLCGEDVSDRADLSLFPDANETSDWAIESVSWAVAADIIRGVGQPDGSLLIDAQGECSRAQVATLLMRLRAADPLDPFA